MTPVNFCKLVLPEGPWVITAIRPKQSKEDADHIHTELFTPDTESRLRAFIGQYEGERNLYIQPNVTSSDVKFGPGRRMTKDQIVMCHFAHVDVDIGAHRDSKQQLDEILEMFTREGNEPSFLVYTGGGYHGWFKLQEPVHSQHLGKVEVANAGLIEKYGGDKGTQDASRLLRLPGTTNIPDWRKKEKGRSVTKTDLVWGKPELTFSFDDLPKGGSAVVTRKPAASIVVTGEPLNDIQELHERWDLPQEYVEMAIDGHGNEDQLEAKTIRLGKSPSRSEWLWDFVCQCVRCGVPDSIILGVLMDEKYGISESVLEKGKRADSYARKQIVDAYEELGTTIDLSDIKVHRVREAIQNAIHEKRELPVYRMAKRLVRVSHDQLVNVEPTWLLDAMSPLVEWQKWDGKARKLKAARATPTDVLPAIRLPEHWPGDDVVGLSLTPTLTRNEPGYDPESQLVLSFNPEDFPKVSLDPSREDAEDGLQFLRAVIDEYEFVQPDVGRSVALAYMLTAAVRSQMRTCPAFLIDAPDIASGKTKLAQIGGIIAGGRDPALLNWDTNPEENKKLVGSHLIAGNTIAIFDNADTLVGGSAVEAALTSEYLSVRVLGSSENPEVSTRVLWAFTGNQLQTTPDFGSRALWCRIKKPSDGKVFSFDPVEKALETRGVLVAAALKVLRWYARQAPVALKPIRAGVFQDFDLVRGALVSLGELDPALSQQSVMNPREDDENRLALALMKQFGTQPFATRKIESLSSEGEWSPRTLLLEDDGRFNSRKAGWAILRLKDRTFFGCVLTQDLNPTHKVSEWRWVGELPREVFATLAGAQERFVEQQESS